MAQLNTGIQEIDPAAGYWYQNQTADLSAVNLESSAGWFLLDRGPACPGTSQLTNKLGGPHLDRRVLSTCRLVNCARGEYAAPAVQTHYLPRWISLGAGHGSTRAYWSCSPSAKALVFVHGFIGKAVDTWLEFPALLQARPEIEGYDIVFYGYDGVNNRVGVSAGLLRQGLHTLMNSAAQLVNASIDAEEPVRDTHFAYESLLIVAHSLGAVVSRQALLDAQRLGQEWVSRSGLVLFAPAHKGAAIDRLIPELALAVLGLLGNVRVPLVRLPTLQVLHDLKPHSPTLIALEGQTREQVEQHAARYLIARKVIFGELETVVETANFCEDPPFDVLPGRRHGDVCKPQTGFLDPVSVVVSALG